MREVTDTSVERPSYTRRLVDEWTHDCGWRCSTYRNDLGLMITYAVYVELPPDHPWVQEEERAALDAEFLGRPAAERPGDELHGDEGSWWVGFAVSDFDFMLLGVEGGPAGVRRVIDHVASEAASVYEESRRARR